MPTQTHEQTINTALGEVLHALGQNWRIRSENVGRIFEEGGRPDILIEKADGWPLVIEAEVGNHRQAEVEAQSRLGRHLVTSPNVIHAAIALIYPEALRNHHGQALRNAIREATLEYALFSVERDGSTGRFPTSGWLSGSVFELAILLHRSSIPAWRVESLADVLEAGVIRAEGAFSASHPHGSALGASVADMLGQSDDEAGQTRRMAMTVVVDAFVFHAALAEAEMAVHDRQSGQNRNVKSPSEFRAHGAFRPTLLLDEWERILEINYWPIFHTAGSVIRILPTQTATTILDVLWSTAEELIAGGVTKSHDLTGVVFQRLIADRKFLATYYTRPSGAALLAGLALPLERPIAGDSWSDGEALAEARIGDFACGTGTLLSTAYQRVGLLHEIHGGDPKALHPVMMQQGLVGLDVLTVAVHLTAAMLAGSHPDTPFEGECLLTMPYGRHEWGVCLGSLDLLEEQTSFEIIQAAAHTAGGRGVEEVRDLMQRVGHGQFDLVIMNPPFTRHGAREGDRTQVHNPAFAAFGADEEAQDHLANHLRHLAAGGIAHGHAGLASYFVDLAHRKTAPSGTLALVLPLSSMSGKSWENVRALWRREYSSILISTIADKGSHTRSFSADTGMAECLFVAAKSRPRNRNPRATFVILDGQPENTLEGELIAQAITTAVANGNVRRLEDGPFGGTRVLLGETFQGEVVDCPLPTEGAWQMVGIRDISLGQTAHQLTHGRLWIEGMAAASVPELPVARIDEVCLRIGPHHLDITGAQIKSDGLPQGPFETISGTEPGMAYPCLWNHDSSRERRLVVEPDSHCRIREVSGRVPEALLTRAETRWATAARAHYNQDLRFNSQSIIIATTEHPCIGGRAWPTVVFEDETHDFAFALWCNSTLGLLCHWWMSNKTQEGRGTTTVTGIPSISTLDLRALSAAQHDAAHNTFEALSSERFLPFDQIDEDAARAELDRRLIVDVLNLDPSLCDVGGPMERLRRKLAAEPQIHANKQTRLVFTETGETNVRRDVT
jgi:predicted RNA methylase